jgi:hydroxymethylglutaryl-CoA reductase (NADPH)
VRIRWSHRNHRQAIDERRQALRALPQFRPEDSRIFPSTRDDDILARYQESYVGQMVLPVSVLGPLAISFGQYHVDDADGHLRETGRTVERVYVPLAHTEGGLSASVLRGMTAANAAGGIHTALLRDEMTRDSAFLLQDAGQAVRLAQWVTAERNQLKSWLHDPDNPGYRHHSADGRPLLSRHARLLTIDTRVVGSTCHLLYRFHTGEACGPNMMTRNAYALNAEIVRRIERIGLAPSHVYVEVNMGGDKKPSWEYFHGGHGKTVLAWVTLPGSAVRRFLHVDAEDLTRLEWAGLHGAHASGMQSFAFSPATTVAAIFAATGQDLGMVATSSMAQASLTPTSEGVTFSLQFSGIEVGTVGGGTTLPHAQSYLRLMDCLGPGSAQRLAQIVAAASLCLEISAAASMASRGSENFVKAHFERGGQRHPESRS